MHIVDNGLALLANASMSLKFSNKDSEPLSV